MMGKKSDLRSLELWILLPPKISQGNMKRLTKQKGEIRSIGSCGPRERFK